jgi:hypothetical protein
LKGGLSKGDGNFFQRFGQGIKQSGLPRGVLGGEGRSVFEKFNVADSNTAIGVSDPESFANRAGDFFSGASTPTNTQVLNSPEYAELLAQGTEAVPNPFELAKAQLTPSLISKYAGPALATGAVAAAVGAFDEIPAAAVPDPYEGPSESERRLANFPRKFGAGPRIAGMGASMDDIMVPYSGEQLAQPTVQVSQSLEEQYPDLYKQYLAENQPEYLPQMQPQYSAAGGPMESFPRRTGYIAGPGTETSDDIPAMLSDGEFVMNAKAVRGAGNGSREQGVRNMYQMMRAFEGGAVA